MILSFEIECDFEFIQKLVVLINNQIIQDIFFRLFYKNESAHFIYYFTIKLAEIKFYDIL